MGVFDWAVGLFSSKSPGIVVPHALDDKGAFCLMLANVLFRVDGKISDQEEEYLKEQTKSADLRVVERITSILEATDTFVEIRNWYNALSEVDKSFALEQAKKLVEIDRERTEEEEAFLIQFAQIAEGNERLPLYVSTALDKTNGKLPNHNLFHYVSERDYRSRFLTPDSPPFRSGAVYIEHPYNEDSLIPFSVEDFEQAQDQLFGGIIELLKELGAKSVDVAESLEEVGNERGDVDASVKAGNAAANVQLAGGADFSIERILRTHDSVNVRFDGSKPPLLKRFLPNRWQQHLLRKYRNNPQCLTIIKNRFGHNKASYFKHQVRSSEARRLAKGINAAAAVDYRLVKGEARMKARLDGAFTRTIEKTLTVRFH
jgi:hypothetical protein